MQSRQSAAKQQQKRTGSGRCKHVTSGTCYLPKHGMDACSRATRRTPWTASREEEEWPIYGSWTTEQYSATH
eukprot:2323008-Lingulodinium_polyedra.AAC.1